MTCKNAANKVQIQRPYSHPIKKVLGAALLIVCALPGFAQDPAAHWADSVLATMSVPEKIGQLFMLRTSARLSKDDVSDLADKIKDWRVGAIYITGGGPRGFVSLSKQLARSSKIPLLFGVNAGVGVGQTLDSTALFLNPMALAAIRNDTLIYQLGSVVARHMKLLGLHLNFAPNVSSWNHDKKYESYFSDNKTMVFTKSLKLVRGLQDHGVMACALQLPKPSGKLPDGKDSVVYYESIRADTMELHGLVRLIHGGVDAVITTQFRFSMEENKKIIPGAIGSAFTNEILRQKMGFEGLAFCDLPQLQRGSFKRKKGEVELLALQAGNDILIDPENLGAAIKLIQKVLKKNPALLTRINTSAKRILMAKFHSGLAANPVIDTDNLMRKLNTADDRLFRHQLAEASVTVARNSFSVLPIRSLEDKTFLYVSVGADAQNEFGHYLSKYAGIESMSLLTERDTAGIEQRLGKNDVVIVGFFPSAEPFQAQLLPVLQRLSSKKSVILCLFGNPMGLRSFAGFPVLLSAVGDDPLLQKVAAQVIFGAMPATGVLPITVNEVLRSGQGVRTITADRVSYTLPEAAGMDSQTLEQIASIANEAIDMKATPGCHVYIARQGKVIGEQSYGYLTYDKKSPVTDQTIYDLASVTKVSATLQAVMFLQEKGLIDINKKASVYLPELKNSNKKDFTIKDILTHQAGLWPFLPFWAQTVKDTVQLPEYYARVGSPEYPYPVASHLYASRGMKDSLWHWIIASKVQEKVHHIPYDYKYSDMGFYIMMHLAEKLLNQPMEEFLDQNFYEVLGASTTGYLPLLRFPSSRIAPTEDDKLFRRSLLIGYVHDQGAAMHGGIAGHAGLFSTPNDLGKLGQMWLQKGSYGGHRYFKPETIELFTKKQFENSRRGLGWDKPVVSDPNGPTSAYASPETFGHTGFTGISIWIDPVFDLVFIFCSNRVYPEMTNNKILNANIRPRVQDIVYRSIFKYCENHN